MVITDDDFEKFREFFYRKTGIFFENSKRYFVDKRLSDRVKVNDCTSFRQYFTMLRFQVSGQELQALTNSMTVNETYFFREDYQFKCMVNSMLPEIVKTKKSGETIRIWSIPSSSGEEAYSIALHLTDYWSGIDSWNVELISSDIDTDILAKARTGIYNKRSVQHVPSTLLKQHFTVLSNGDYQISRDYREAVEFTRVNLSEPSDTRAYRNFDLIFCRNLLIYFDDISRARAAEVFYDALNPGGFVCLGHSESMSRISSLFRVRKFPEAIVYQKPEANL